MPSQRGSVGRPCEQDLRAAEIRIRVDLRRAQKRLLKGVVVAVDEDRRGGGGAAGGRGAPRDRSSKLDLGQGCGFDDREARPGSGGPIDAISISDGTCVGGIETT